MVRKKKIKPGWLYIGRIAFFKVKKVIENNPQNLEQFLMFCRHLHKISSKYSQMPEYK